jgi:muramoyltetrapeptide carboxypeptidase
MIAPPLLKKGDKIAIVAPAGRIDNEEIRPAIDILHSWGLEVILGANLLKTYHQFSGTDEERAADLQGVLDEASVKTIISARGGYGTLRIIDKLDFSLFCKNPKWVVGYSDITVLHSHIHKNFGLQTLHGPMPLHFTKNDASTESLRKALFYGEFDYALEAHPLNRSGEVRAVIAGGNLSLLCALNGSSSGINTEGKILFIEDVAEHLYHLDRMMLSLKRSGMLDSLAGLIIGGLTEMKDGHIPFGKTAEEIVSEAVSGYKYPVSFNFPAGHVNKNFTLLFGRIANFSVSESLVSLNYC